jgi:hypothetical protein
VTIEELLVEMRKHTLENPTHGYNCACKDAYLQQIRARVGFLEVIDEIMYVDQMLRNFRKYM